MNSSPTYHPFERLESKIRSLFPSLEDMLLMYTTTKGLIVEKNATSIVLDEKIKTLIQKKRNTNLHYQWLRPSDFLFFEGDSTFKQLNLLDEYENRLLVITFISPIDRLKDIIAINFPKDVRFFGVQKEMRFLNTDEKSIIGEMVHKMLNFDYEELLEERKKLIQVQHYYTLLQQEHEQKEEFSLFFEKTCVNITNSIPGNTVSFSFTKDLLVHLASLQIDFDALRNKIIEACHLSKIINPLDDQIILTKNHFLVSDWKETSIDTTKQSPDRVYELLNRYEEAAKKANDLGLNINGKIVSQYLTPAISPPAVTDSIKKNARKIEIYLKNNPSNWTLIRKYIKPIRELDEINGNLRRFV